MDQRRKKRDLWQLSSRSLPVMVVSVVRPGLEILLFVGEVAEKRIHGEEKKEEHKKGKVTTFV